MKVTIIGTGYVGLVTGTCFAEMGNEVVCVDIDAKKVEKMSEGFCPIYEAGLESMMKSNIEEKRLSFSTAYDSVKSSQAIFLAVGTPSSDNGQADLSYLFSACDGIAPYIQNGAVVVVKSTVPIGTGHKVEAYLRAKTKNAFALVNNPEFLKEGSAVEDFMRPDRVIIGASNAEAAQLIEDLYEPFVRQTKRTIHMSNLSAELTKYAANCFLATKISYINEVARLCDIVGADVEEVRHGLATDPRIGSQFLYSGPGYGGSCFPKDIKALIHTASENGLDLKIVKAAEEVNKNQKRYMVDKVLKHFGDVKGKTFTLWGVAFKANTDDIRETPAIDTARILRDAGAKVRFYDPEAGDNFQRYMNSIDIPVDGFENKYDALNGSDALIVLTEWKQFRAPDFEEIKSRLKDKVIFDARNLYNTQKILDMGFKYYGIGKKCD
jgi:UDPglucose 6-dehydrogenase